MKKWIALLLTAIMCLSLVACGGGKSPSTDADVTTSHAGNANEENTDVQDNGEQTESKPVADTTIYHFGDTVSVSDGMFEFTPVFEGFTAKLANWPDKDFMTPDGQFSGQTPYEASEEKVMMYFSGTINYVGESKENELFGYNFTVDYKNGYLFDFAGGEAWNSGKGYHSGCGITSNIESGDWNYKNMATFEPLSSNKTRYVRFCIEVPNQLEADSGNVIITFHINGEDRIFTLG